MSNNQNNAPKLLNLKPKDGVLRVMPLGGVGEIGMNCTLFEYNGDMIMVDCGQMMPDEEMLGVDYVIPDIAYLLENTDRLRGIFLTHAHEDHVGALPYILPQLPKNIPVYGSELTIAIQKEKMKEHKQKPNYKVMHAREKIEAGKFFTLEPLTVTHSIIDAFGFAISTPIGTVIHSGDFKMDPAPTDGVFFDYHAFANYAEGPDQGVLLLMADSTNSDRDGVCGSESLVIPTLRRLMQEATGQLIISCFSSSLHRIQTVLNLAAEMDKIVFSAGLNMERNIRVAHEIGAIDIPCRYHDWPDRIATFPKKDRVILTTGSQGEPLAGLTRMALGGHKNVVIEPGDSVVLTTRLIPGNEKAIYRLINHLTRRGAKVHYQGNTPNVHVSGHAYRDEMRHLINLVNPKYFTPIHGEFRHLSGHAGLAEEMGMMPDEINVIENGDCLEVTPHYARVIGKIPHGRVFVDGKGVGDVEEVVLRDRKYLSNDGVVNVILSVDRETGEVLGGPYIHTRGFVSEEDGQRMIEEMQEVVLEAYHSVEKEGQLESSVVQAAVKKAIKQYIKQQTSRFPVILPVIMEI